MPRDKSRHREKRSSSYSSDSSYERKKSKSKHKRRSRSRDRSESSYKKRRSTSRSRTKKTSYSRSPSKERYESKLKRRSRSKKSHRRSASRDRSLSRCSSSSRSRSKHTKKHKTRRRSNSSNSRSSSIELERPLVNKRFNQDDTESKVEKAIKAAEAAGLTMTKIPTYEYRDVEIKEDMPTIHDRNLLAELNNESFVQKSFTSSRNKKFSDNIIIDLNTETIRVPEAEAPKDDTIINFAEIPSEEELKEMWVKKLYQYRKKMLKEQF